MTRNKQQIFLDEKIGDTVKMDVMAIAVKAVKLRMKSKRNWTQMRNVKSVYHIFTVSSGLFEVKIYIVCSQIIECNDVI